MRRVETFRHSAGGGVIVGIDGAISSDSYLSADSMIEGASFVSYSSRIIKSAIKDSHVSFANISESAVLHSHVAGAIVRSSGIEGAVIRGSKSRIANVQNCLLGSQTVVEACVVRDFELSGPFLLHSDWNRAPRHLLLEPALGVRIGISECKPGYAHAGCECRSIQEWVYKKELLRKIFVRRGWPSETIDIIHEFFEELQRVRLAAA